MQFDFTTRTEAQLKRLSEFKPNILITTPTFNNIDECINEINKHDIIGFDTESPPKSKCISLIQISTEDNIYLFEKKTLKTFIKLKNILKSNKIVKVGIDIVGDIDSLETIDKLKCEGFIDLQSLIYNYGYCYNRKKLGTKQMVGIILNKYLPKQKKITMSFGSNYPLNLKQLMYAAADADVCRIMYLKLQKTNELHIPKTVNI